MTTALRSGIATSEIIRKSMDSAPLRIREILQILVEEQLLAFKKFSNVSLQGGSISPRSVIDCIFPDRVLKFFSFHQISDVLAVKLFTGSLEMPEKYCIFRVKILPTGNDIHVGSLRDKVNPPSVVVFTPLKSKRRPPAFRE